MDPHNPAPLYQLVGGHGPGSSTPAHPTVSAIITSPPAAPTATATLNAGAPTAISPPSPPTTPIVARSDAGGPPWPRPPTPGPGPTLPDRIFVLDDVDTPPDTPIAGPSFPQYPVSSEAFANDNSDLLASLPVRDGTLLPDIFEPPKVPSLVSCPVLRLRPDSREEERHGTIRSLDAVVNTAGFEVGNPAGEDFYGDAGVDSGSEASSLSSLWASRAYFDRESGEVGESVRIREHGHEHRGNGEVKDKGKHKAVPCAYCDSDSDPHHGGHFSDSGTATGDEAPRRAGPFVPSFHDSQAAPVKRGSFVFRNGYGSEDGDVHERGGDGGDELRVPAGCELEFPLAPGRSENRWVCNAGPSFASPASEREIHRFPAPASVCIRRPPATTAFYRGRRRHRSPAPRSISEPSVIQLMTPQGTVGAQFNNVADVQVTTETELMGGGYGIREIRSNGGCDEVRRGWGGVKGCVVEFKGGDKWELTLKGREAELNKASKRGRESPSGYYDGDDEGTIGATSDSEDAVTHLNAQSANSGFVLGPGETRPYILDVIHDDPNKAVSRYTDVADYSVHLRGAEKGNSFTVRLRDIRGSLVIMWKRVARVEIVLVGGVEIEINAGDGEESENDGGEVVAGDVGLRGGGDKDKGSGSGQGENSDSAEKARGIAQETANSTPAVDISRSTHHPDSPAECAYPGDYALLSCDDESGGETPKRSAEDKGKGKAIDDGDATPRNNYHSDSENHGSIPLCYEIPTDYVKTLGPPHRIENPEPDYVLGSCPCFDRPITDADTSADPPQCTCISPTSPGTPAPEPWTGGYFSPRYQAFLRDGPSNEPYNHSCTAHSEFHGEWVDEVRGNPVENIASQASSPEGLAGVASPKGASSMPKPFDIKRVSNGSPSGGSPNIQRNAEGQATEDLGNAAPMGGLDGPSEAVEPEGSGTDSHAHSNQRGSVENGGNSSTNLAGDTTRGNKASSGQPHAYTDRHASGFQSFQGPPQIPTFNPLHHHLSPFQIPGQPTITTIQIFPPHELQNIQYQHPTPVYHPPFIHYNPYIPHPHSQTHPSYQSVSTLPEIPESNYFYPDGRSARLRFPTPPDQASGQHPSSGNQEPAPPTAPQNPARITQATASQSAPPRPSSRGYNAHLVEEQIVGLMGAFELLRDMHIDLAQRLASGRL